MSSTTDRVCGRITQTEDKTSGNEFTRVMLSSGLDIENFKPIKARNKDDVTAYYAATLCQANNDLNSLYAQRLARDGTQEYTSSCIHARTP